MTTPQDEAVRILSDVIEELTASSRDLIAILRKCQHVCEILGWESQKSWFHYELNGYTSADEVPNYRIISGQLIWEPIGSTMDKVHWNTDSFMGDLSPEDTIAESTTIKIWARVGWIIGAAQNGYRNPTGETKVSNLRSGDITLQQVEIAHGMSFSHLIAEIERSAFDFASMAYTQLRYGNIISDLWMEYRIIVDEGIQQLNLNSHLLAIQDGLVSENPESWRTSVIECRNIFEDLANILWQDPRKTYNFLPGRDKDGKSSGKLDVTKGLFKNQLRAYIHQKGLGRKQRLFLQSEIDRLADSISSLISFQSKAHRPISKPDAISIAIATYYVLGELIIRTDMQPVEEYGNPEKGEDSD